MFSEADLFAESDSEDERQRQQALEAQTLRRTKSKTRRQSAMFAAKYASVSRKIGGAAIPGVGQGGTSSGNTIYDRGYFFYMGKVLALQVAKLRYPGSGGSVDHGIPVREGLIYMFKITRDKSVQEALLFFVFLVLFMVIVFLLYDVHEAFASNSAIEDLLLKEELAGTVYKKDFSEIMTQTEMWQWLEGPLADGLWPEEYYNGAPIPPDQQGYALDTLRVVGAVQLRQSRASLDSCGSYGRSDLSRDSVTTIPWVDGVSTGVLWTGAPSAGLGVPQEEPGGGAGGGAPNGTQVASMYSDSFGAAGLDVPSSLALPACLQRGTDPYTGLPACVSGYDTMDGLCVDVFREGETEERRPFVRTGALEGAAAGSPGLQLRDPDSGLTPQQAVEQRATTLLGDGVYEVDDTTRVYTWQDGLSSQDGLFGYGPSYGTGGYTAQLPASNRTEALRRLAMLKQDGWTDRATRAVGVYVNLYNTATRRLTVSRMLFELFPSGHVIKSARFYTVPVVVYDRGLDRFRMALELVFVLYLVYYFVKQVRRVAYAPSVQSYVTRFANLFELSILALAFLILGQWLRFVVSSIQDFDVNEPRFTDYFDEAEIFVNVTSWAGIMVLMLVLKLFQFLSINKRFALLWLTLYRAAVDIAAFAVTFFLVAGGFAFAGHNLFGHVLVDFKSFGFSFATLLRYALGMFSYEDLAQARPAVAGIFFTLYVGMVTLVVLSMVVAVLVRHYHAIIEEQRFYDRWLESALTFEASLMIRMRVGCKEMASWCRSSVCFSCCPPDTTVIQSGDSGSVERPGGSKDLPPASSSSSSSSGAGGDSGGTNEERERRTWQAEAAFLKVLHKCMQQAKWTRSIDLFEYFEKVYQESGSNNFLYVGWEELVALTTKPGRTYDPPMAAHPKLSATQLIEAYTAWKDTTVVGAGTEHERVEQEVNRLGLRPYVVNKVNRAGQVQRRRLYIDQEKAQVLNFAGSKMTKRLPVTQLVQLEQTDRYPARLSMVFTSQGVPPEDEELMGAGGLETKFVIDFQSQQRAMQFLKEIRQCRAEMVKRIEQLQKDLGEAGAAAAAAQAGPDGSVKPGGGPKPAVGPKRKGKKSIRERVETERRATVTPALKGAGAALSAAMAFRRGTTHGTRSKQPFASEGQEGQQGHGQDGAS